MLLRLLRTLKALPFRAMTADALTFSRLVVAGVILWLGWTYGAAALPAVVLLATAGWVSDGIDGFLARRSARVTLLHAYDYHIDVILAWSFFLYLGAAGFLTPTFILVYSLLAFLVFWRLRRKAVLVLFMRGVDLSVAITALRFAFVYSLPLLLWLAIYGFLNRERFWHSSQRWLHELASLARNRTR